MAKHVIAYAFMILPAGLLGLAGCSSSPNNDQTEAEQAMAARLDMLENRVSVLEHNRMPSSRTDGGAVPIQSPSDGNDGKASGSGLSNSQGYDQQEYERQVQALCASKGVDCSR